MGSCSAPPWGSRLRPLSGATWRPGSPGTSDQANDQEQAHNQARTTIPQAVRDALQLEPGDELLYQIKGGQVILSKATSSPFEEPFASFGEWAAEEDREAFSDL